MTLVSVSMSTFIDTKAESKGLNYTSFQQIFTRLWNSVSSPILSSGVQVLVTKDE